MHLTPKEIDKLLLLSLGAIAERRLKKGLKLNHPEAVAYITATALEGAREGKTVEEVMKEAAPYFRTGKPSPMSEAIASVTPPVSRATTITNMERTKGMSS